MTVVSGFRRPKEIRVLQMIFLKRREIIFLKEDIRHSVILFRGMSLQGQSRSAVTQAMVVGETKLAVNLDFRDAIKSKGRKPSKTNTGTCSKCIRQ